MPAPGSAAGPDLALSPAQFDRLIAYGFAAEVSVGDVLFAEGALDVDLIVVESASVVLTAGTDAEPLYEYGPGSVIGELVLLTGHGVQFSAQATQPGVVHRVTPMSLRNLLLEERELSELLLTAFMARRRRGRNDRGGRVTLEIVGTPQSPATQALRTYANRTGIKHTWLDADGPSGRSLMSAAGLVGADLPAVVGPRETVINATPADLVTIRDGTPRAGVVDVVVVGAGPAGLAAAMGCALVGMSTVTLDREGPGGHAAQATRLEHYLGFPTGVTGTELMSPGARPGSGGRARLVSPCAVLSLTPSTDASTLSLADGSELSARAVIVASGATYPTADRPGWQEFGGRGFTTR